MDYNDLDMEALTQAIAARARELVNMGKVDLRIQVSGKETLEEAKRATYGMRRGELLERALIQEFLEGKGG
jgi:hypothetical protein